MENKRRVEKRVVKERGTKRKNPSFRHKIHESIKIWHR